MGMLEGYFVPLHSFNLTPESFEQKVHNVRFAFELMTDAGLPKPKARPEGAVRTRRFPGLVRAGQRSASDCQARQVAQSVHVPTR